MNASQKYGRSLHAQISLGTTSDDRFMPNGYVKAFAEMSKLVLTEKLDGQNNCFNKYGVFARSHANASIHPWDKPLHERWELMKNDLGDIEIFGENMYGIHSIEYRQLDSYFYVFAVREGERWLSWEEVQFYAALFDFPTVPTITLKKALKECIGMYADENKVLDYWLTQNLGMTWLESVETPGLLDGRNPLTEQPCSEGFVIRNADAFHMNEGVISVATNEFNNLFKLVRKAHVKTDVHWTKTWKPAKLTDYAKYNWHAYEFLNR
ncbi:MAG: RNA ligase family protein [Chitinophagales bacterium]|nr:RNA ligase family protein [Chitinophagales bacterium]